ncbi:MAG: DNA methyltransferase [Thermoplasmatales archaeon]
MIYSSTQKKFDVPEIDEEEIRNLKQLLEKLYYSIKSRFLNISEFQDVILKHKSYSSSQLKENQKPETMVRQYMVDILLPFLGYTYSNESGLKTPFGNRYPDYTIRGNSNPEMIIYVEVEPINTNLYADGKGIKQVEEWLISKAAKTEYGIVTDGLTWILVKFDNSTNKIKEIFTKDLTEFFKHLLNPKDAVLPSSVVEALREFLDLKSTNLGKILLGFLSNVEDEKETITKKFYAEYTKFVFGVDENGNPTGGICLKDGITPPAEVKDPKKELFAVITMNRLLFISFLVEKSLAPVNILTGLLKEYKETNKSALTFYSIYLKPLFYDVFNTSPSHRKAEVKNVKYYSKIPYLNGGLFRYNVPHESEYDITNDSIELVIENLIGKYDIGLSGDAKLQPEILGYIFEKTINYISGTGKSAKQKMEGAYYTPEDVVNFIIDQTLGRKVFDKMIEGLAKAGWTERDMRGYESIEDILQDLPPNPKHTNMLLNALDEIKVIDPACGSGHFLTAAANFLTRIRASILIARSEHPSLYELKRMVISKNIYGVDIDNIGVEITKLRLWLSIISEAKLDEIGNVEHVETLPNIDFNIVSGNSLIGHLNEKLAIDMYAPESGFFESSEIAFIDSLAEPLKSTILPLMKSGKIEDMINAYQQLLKAYRVESGEKAFGMREILTKIKSKMHKTLSQSFYFYIASYVGNDKGKHELIWKSLRERSPIHWTLDFVNVIAGGGFDVVLGNPPYIEDGNYESSDLAIIRMMKKTKGKSIPLIYKSQDSGNTHAYFIERSIDLLNKTGRFGFIIPISLVSTDRMKSIREFIHSNSSSVAYYNFDDRPGKIFSGIQDCRSTILITKRGDGVDNVLTSKYNRWYSNERSSLFRDLHPISYNMKNRNELIPKIGSQIELAILEKMRSQSSGKNLGDFQTNDGKKSGITMLPGTGSTRTMMSLFPRLSIIKIFQWIRILEKSV